MSRHCAPTTTTPTMARWDCSDTRRPNGSSATRSWCHRRRERRSALPGPHEAPLVPSYEGGRVDELEAVPVSDDQELVLAHVAPVSAVAGVGLVGIRVECPQTRGHQGGVTGRHPPKRHCSGSVT